MHGIVHQRLKAYVERGAGEDAWETVLDRADVEPTLYLAVSHYPDAEFESLFATLVELTGHDRTTLERDFGHFLAPTLHSTFPGHRPDASSYADLLCELDSLAASFAGSESDPPTVAGERTDGTITVTYRSERGYCAIAHGVLEGMAEPYDATVGVEEVDCESDGADRCTFRVAVDE